MKGNNDARMTVIISTAARESHPLRLLEGIGNWRSYIAALQQCDRWWSNRHSWSVLGEQCSWRETVEVLHDVVSHPDWGELDQYDRQRLLGLTRR